MGNADNFRKWEVMLKATGILRTECKEGDNCTRRLKNSNQNHQDEENGDLSSREETKKENHLFGINYQKNLPLRHTLSAPTSWSSVSSVC